MSNPTLTAVEGRCKFLNLGSRFGYVDSTRRVETSFIEPVAGNNTISGMGLEQVFFGQTIIFVESVSELINALLKIDDTGGRIILAPGTYALTASLGVLPDRTILEGESKDVIFTGTDIEALQISGNRIAQLKNLTFNWTNTGGTPLKVITLDGAFRSRVENCCFNLTGLINAIQFQNTVDNCRVMSCQFNQAGAGDSAFINVESGTLITESSWISNCRMTGAKGISLVSGTNNIRLVKISQNKINSGQFSAIELNKVSYISVLNNDISGVSGGFDAIMLTEVDNSLISGNSIQGKSNGITLTNSSNRNLIRANTIFGPGGGSGSGIRLFTGSSASVDNSIINNRLSDLNIGISIDNPVSTNNFVSKNQINSDVGTPINSNLALPLLLSRNLNRSEFTLTDAIISPIAIGNGVEEIVVLDNTRTGSLTFTLPSSGLPLGRILKFRIVANTAAQNIVLSPAILDSTGASANITFTGTGGANLVWLGDIWTTALGGTRNATVIP